jgi:hypothetical protein
LIRSIAELTANNGRMVFSPADAIKSRPSIQRASLRFRAQSYGSFSGAIATIVLPQLRLGRLDRADPAQRLIQPCRHQSKRTISACQRGVNWKMGKLARDQTLASQARRGRVLAFFNRR